MNKPELIDLINKLPDDIQFLSATDDEGNSYRWINGVSVEYIHKYEAEDYIVDSVLSEEDAKEDFTEEEIKEQLVKVAVIW